MKHSPCYRCTERFPACHDSCEQYKEWAKLVREIRKTKREDNENIRVSIESIYRFKRKKGEKISD